MADVLRSVLFVDFDNVFFSLQSADKDAAKAFANDPRGWLDAIESGALIEEDRPEGAPVRRRILMRRCYANPAIMRYFRGWFTRSGFQIVDCPPLTGQGKNSADIYMVVDMLDALRHETRFDEFIILSGDADFTPVLTRLRAHDRRSVIYSNAVTAAAYKSLCDGMITEERLIDLAGGEEADEPADAPAPRPERRPEPARAEATRPEPMRPEPMRAEAQRSEPARPEARIEPRVVAVEGIRPGGAEPRAPGPRRLYRQRATPGPEESSSEGAAGGARLPRLTDEIEPIARRVAAATDVPPFAPEVYASLFRALAAEVHERGFSLNRTVNAVIRKLADGGMRLRPQSVAFVVKGLMLSGHQFVATDTPGTLAKAFRRQVLYLAASGDLVLADEERALVGAWIVGGLRSVPSSEAMAIDEVPSEARLAAEAAGVSIEETVHGLAPDGDDRGASESRPAPMETADGGDEDYGASSSASEPDFDGDDDGSDETEGADEDDAGRPSRPPRDIDALLARMRTPSRS